MDKDTKNLFPTVDKDILKRMDEETANMEVNIAELPQKKKILKHSNVFGDDKPLEKEQEKEQEQVEVENEPQVVENKPPSPIKKKKTYPHLEKARAVAKANREAKKALKLQEKMGKKEETNKRRLEKQRVASKQRYWNKKEQAESKEVFMTTEIKKLDKNLEGLTYQQFRKYQSKYETEKQAESLVKEKKKLQEENERLKKQIKTNNSFNRSPDYPDYFNTGNRYF